MRTTPPLGDGMMPILAVVGATTAWTMVLGEECRMSRGVRAIRTIANPTLVAVLEAVAAILAAGTTVVLVVMVVVALAIPATITLPKQSEAMRIHRSIVQIAGVVHHRQPLQLHQEDGANRLTMPEVVPWLDLTRRCILPELDDMAILALPRLRLG